MPDVSEVQQGAQRHWRRMKEAEGDVREIMVLSEVCPQCDLVGLSKLLASLATLE